MSEQTTFDWDAIPEDEHEDNRPFLNFEETKTPNELIIALKFEEAGPFHIAKDNFGKDKYIYRVLNMEGHPHLFSTSSKRCMRVIKELRPLTDKAIQITRTGIKFDTDYSAEEI